MTGIIVHEWLEKRGGAEGVVDAMRESFPDAGLVALWNDAPEKYRDVRESWLAHTPLRRHKALSLPLQPMTWRHVLPRSHVDWVLVSSHLFAHHVDVRNRSGERVPKYVYAHTPARYIWAPELDERGQAFPARAASALLKPLDRNRAQEAVAIAANSRFVRERVHHAWGREATVIYPPVRVDEIRRVADWRTKLNGEELCALESLPQEFVLGASRFVPYKRLDWVIRVGAAFDVPVVIAGDGPEEPHLRTMAAEARVPVQFVLRPSTPMLYALYQAALAFVFPAIEDFGIMPVEAQAAGTPVVTTSVGGATESHVEGLTGVSAVRDDEHALVSALEKAILLRDEAAMRAEACHFSSGAFQRSLKRWMKDAL
ncbi:glycosyltransferase [Propionibacterium sp.]|uniref:glycosyltransferase n=1 Tax=Propionibacterium sp. TaxID=1977903 RepID=UPI0039EC3856